MKEPTRGNHLLDIVMSDAPRSRCKVDNQITDHICVHTTFNLSLTIGAVLERKVWRWDLADWPAIHARLDGTNWFYLTEGSVDDGAEWLQTNFTSAWRTM